MSDRAEFFLGGTSLERAAVRASGNPHWTPWQFTTAANGVMVRGAVCPLIARGPRKGLPNVLKRDRNTESVVLVTRAMWAEEESADVG